VALTAYETYIRTEELLAPQKAPDALTRHAELQLQVIYQAHELSMKLIKEVPHDHHLLDRGAGDQGPRPRVPRMIGPARRSVGTLTAAALIAATAALSSGTGCNFAVNHPAVTASLVGGTLGLGTCKLASDNIGTCLAVGGGAGAFLGLFAAAAIWLGGDGHSVLIEEQAQPLPDDGRPIKRRRRRPVEPEAAPAADPASPAPTSPAPVSPAPVSPGPAPVSPSPAPVSPSPAPVSPSVTPASPSPAPVSPTVPPPIPGPAPTHP
jgi:hypothetical protein